MSCFSSNCDLLNLASSHRSYRKQLLQGGVLTVIFYFLISSLITNWNSSLRTSCPYVFKTHWISDWRHLQGLPRPQMPEVLALPESLLETQNLRFYPGPVGSKPHFNKIPGWFMCFRAHLSSMLIDLTIEVTLGVRGRASLQSVSWLPGQCSSSYLVDSLPKETPSMQASKSERI